jgi:hypothetical protein
MASNPTHTFPVLLEERFSYVPARCLSQPLPPHLSTERGSIRRRRRPAGIRVEIAELSGNRLSVSELPKVTVDNRALHVYTSGTTGLLKAPTLAIGC